MESFNIQSNFSDRLPYNYKTFFRRYLDQFYNWYSSDEAATFVSAAMVEYIRNISIVLKRENEYSDIKKCLYAIRDAIYQSENMIDFYTVMEQNRIILRTYYRLSRTLALYNKDVLDRTPINKDADKDTDFISLAFI